MGKNLKQLLYYTIGPFFAKILAFLLLPIISYFVTVKDYGEYTYFTVLLLYFTPMITLSTEQYFLRVYSDKNGRQLRKTMIKLYISLMILIELIVSLLFVFNVFNYENYLIYLIAIATAFFTGVQELYIRTFRSRNLGEYYSIVVIVGQIFGFLVNLILVLLMKSVLGLILGQLLSVMIVCCIAFIIQKYRVTPKEDKPTKENRIRLKKILFYSIPLLPGIFLWVIQSSIGRVFLTNNSLMLGIYGVGFKFASITNLFVMSFLIFWEPNLYHFFDHYNDSKTYLDKISEYKELYNVVIEFIILCVVIANPIIMLTMASGYRSVMYVLPVMILNNYINGYSYFAGMGPQLTGKTNKTILPLIISVVMNIGMLILFKNNNVLTVNVAANSGIFILLVLNVLVTNRIIKYNVNINLDLVKIVLYNIFATLFYFNHNYYMIVVEFFLIYLLFNIKSIMRYHQFILGFIKNKVTKKGF